MAGLGKKPALMCGQPFRQMFDKMSKAALIDALYCACQLGTNESGEEIATQAARNAVIALRNRGDRCPPDILSQSENAIDSD